jgi:hypothetical protein
MSKGWNLATNECPKEVAAKPRTCDAFACRFFPIVSNLLPRRAFEVTDAQITNRDPLVAVV